MHYCDNTTIRRPHLTKIGAITGSAHAQELAYHANKHAPSLVTHDRFGNRVDQVEFHPAYHELMKIGVENNGSAWAWQNYDKPGAKHYPTSI